MIKRTMLIGDYNTAVHGLWTLASCTLSEPAPVTNWVDVPGRVKGPLDLSTALTDGLPVYGPRSLSATLESSEGDRATREARISDMINKLHGQSVEVVLPDHPNRYAVARIAVARQYNDLAHCAVKVTGTCEPWLYNVAETEVQLTATTTEKNTTLYNQGAMPVVPVLTVTGETVLLQYGSDSLSMTPGTYEWPTLLLTTGEHNITYSGSGTLTVTYREAVLR